MFRWYQEGTPKERKTFWACYSGWALDSYDVQIFSFLLPTLMGLWALTKAEVGMIGTAALLSAAAGGWIAGIISDRIGRVRVLVFTVIWFTAWGIVAGFAQNYWQLMAARVMQGFGFGGEWAVGAALIGEVINPKHRGKAMGFVQSAFSLGWLGSAITAITILAIFEPDLAWRMTFWLSAIPAALIFWVRRGLDESTAYKKAAERPHDKASFATVFKPQYIKFTTLGALLVFGMQASSYVVLIWLPTLLVERGLQKGSQLLTIFVMATGTFCGFVLTAYLSDRWGRKATLLFMSVASWILTVTYMLVPLTPALSHILSFFVGAGVIGMFAAIGPFLSELFPTEVRTTCMGFSYNLGKTAAAFCITGVGLLAVPMGLAPAIAVFCFVAYALACLALLLLPETKGRDLTAISLDLPDGAQRAPAT
ncbi:MULTISPECIES: MFS transporter [unclassified Paracoccus (in: a-proteobacteria)]|uniref:MFS transporter n=1 Tax=unclassified Paracoccus (in: a-proteobacteria) TaxID=2688777 RepID=UPI0015FED96B|nr:MULTISPECIES: MFS transporter [unclassified Paracoccus (in: a-proteobacteria)]MBB1492326.1 MFS transporter [Paracoccus sp. MC1854]MBB1498405.1 MFS transporter [Paracoccus sp. MC1862]